MQPQIARLNESHAPNDTRAISPQMGGRVTSMNQPIMGKNQPRPPRAGRIPTDRGTGERFVAKVMVVDDAAFMRLRACKVLQDNGHKVVQAENGADAVRQYAEHRPDAVL